MAAAAPPDRSLRYRAVRAFARLLLRSEYRRVEVVGAERVPAQGAVLLVANHHASLVDSLAILVGSPRVAGPMAKAPLWRMRVLAPFLDAVGAVPVYRPQDAAENEGRGARANLETFAECIRRLRDGRAVALFPEGMSRPSPRLLPLRTGAARIALDAEVPVAVVPIGIAIEPPRSTRGTLLVRFGAPLLVDGRTEPAPRRAAITSVTRRTEEAIRALLAEATSLEDVELLRVGAAVVAAEHGVPAASLEARHALVQRLAAGFDALGRADPAERDALRADAAAFARRLDLVGVPLELVDARFSTARVARFVGSTLARAAIVGPLALAAAVVTAPPRVAADLVALRAGHGAEDVVSFGRMLSRTVFLAAWALLLAVVLAVAVAPWAGLAALAAVPASFALHVAWRDARVRTLQRVRSFFLLAGGRLRDDLRAERRALADRIERARARVEDATAAPR